MKHLKKIQIRKQEEKRLQAERMQPISLGPVQLTNKDLGWHNTELRFSRQSSLRDMLSLPHVDRLDVQVTEELASRFSDPTSEKSYEVILRPIGLEEVEED